jgi:AcrR family transcriptional regulator
MAVQRDQVVAAGLQLLDNEGVEGLTLRKLAQELDIKAPSLYWHFANKQELIEAVADALLADVARDVPADQHWRATIEKVAIEVRQALKARRDGARVFAGAYVVSDNVLRTGEAMITTVVNAGGDIELATTAALSTLYFVLGLVTEEQAFAHDASRRAQLEGQAYERFPRVYEARDVLFSDNFEARFNSGLALLLDGVAARLGAAPSPSSTSARAPKAKPRRRG